MTNEFSLIVEAARRLREKDRYYSKKIFPGVKLTYWDAEDYRLLVLTKKINPLTIKTKYGYVLEIWPELEKIEIFDKDGEITLRCDGSHVVEFQFAPETQLSILKDICSVFDQSEIFELDYEGKKQMIDYCKKMDIFIIETAKELNKAGVALVFQKLWQEFGGATDRLVKRIEYYKKLAALYKVDKTRWLTDMKKAGLL